MDAHSNLGSATEVNLAARTCTLSGQKQQLSTHWKLNWEFIFRHEKVMKGLKKLEDEVSRWPEISVHPHRFGGKEFRYGSAEVGHVHTGGVVDIPSPFSVHDPLLAGGLAEEHRWVPTQAGSLFTSAAMKTSGMPGGL